TPCKPMRVDATHACERQGAHAVEFLRYCGGRTSTESHMPYWNRRKSLASVSTRDEHSALKPTLGWPHLIGLGVGAIVGTGIYTLTGVGAGLAGPGVILSFVIA